MRLITSLLIFVAIVVCGMDKSLVFRMDFDSPVQIGSDSLDVPLAESAIVPGKFGKGYYFQRSSYNFLPPGAAEPTDKNYFIAKNGCVLSFEKEGNDALLGATNGRFQMKETAVTLWNRRHYYMKPMTALTYSCWIKGPKDSKVTLMLDFLPEEIPAQKIPPALKKYEKNKYVNCDPAYADKFRADIPGKMDVVLTGEWQNVALYAEVDVRSTQLRSIKAVLSADIQAGGKVFFKKMQMEHTMFYPFDYQQTGFLPGMTERPRNASGIELSLDSIRKLFPVKEGTISFFMKTPSTSNIPAVSAGFFCYGSGWRTPMWCVDNGRNMSGVKNAVYLKNPSLTYQEWTHYAMTWNEKETAVFLNGKMVPTSPVPRDFKEFPSAGYIFCVGKNIWPERSANAVMDEFLIFSKALTQKEIEKLASSQGPFASTQKNSSIQVRPFAVPRFYRNDPNAGLTLEIMADQPQEVTAELISDFHSEKVQISLKKGTNTLKLPFHPELRTPGRGKWTLKLSNAEDTLYQKDGEYVVEGALRKDSIRFLSWGGDGAVPFEYETQLGINARNAAPGNAEQVVANKMMLSLDLRNHRALPKNNFDIQKTVNENRDDVREFRDCFAWYGTMLNSEAIGSWPPASWGKYPQLLKMAEKELGFRPPISQVRINPDMCIDRNTHQFDANGVFTPGEAWKTLHWYRMKGDMIYHLNIANGNMIKSFQPENLLWTEPANSGLFNSVDMGADWAYEPELQDIAGRLRKGWSTARDYGKKYQPTLTMYYWINYRESGEYNGRSCYLPRSVDHLIADCWVAAGVAPMHDLCFFNTYAWYDAENEAKEYLPMKGMAQTFGTFIREKFYPAAMLLRDMNEPPAKVALLVPEDIAYYSDTDWNYRRVCVQWLRSLSQRNIHYDVVTGEKLHKDGLHGYTTIIVPMRSKASAFVHDALMKASAHAKIVVDGYCPATYPNMVKLNFRWPGSYDFEKFAVCDDFVKTLSETNTGLSARAVGSKGPVMLFEKVYQGVHYFVVVNNTWTEGYISQYAKNKRMQGLPFTPNGVAQAVQLTFESKGTGTVVYDFLASRPMETKKSAQGKKNISFDLAPGEGKLFCVYPEKLGAMSCTVQGKAAPGNTCYLECKMKTVSGKPAPGRQILALTIRDGAGKTTDECGCYVMENGSVKLPVRIALDSAPGKWQAEVTERTTGQRCMIDFNVIK